MPASDHPQTTGSGNIRGANCCRSDFTSPRGKSSGVSDWHGHGLVQKGQGFHTVCPQGRSVGENFQDSVDRRGGDDLKDGLPDFAVMFQLFDGICFPHALTTKLLGRASPICPGPTRSSPAAARSDSDASPQHLASGRAGATDQRSPSTSGSTRRRINTPSTDRVTATVWPSIATSGWTMTTSTSRLSRTRTSLHPLWLPRPGSSSSYNAGCSSPGSCTMHSGASLGGTTPPEDPWFCVRPAPSKCADFDDGSYIITIQAHLPTPTPPPPTP
jgi:hypothetical protein